MALFIYDDLAALDNRRRQTDMIYRIYGKPFGSNKEKAVEIHGVDGDFTITVDGISEDDGSASAQFIRKWEGRYSENAPGCFRIPTGTIAHMILYLQDAYFESYVQEYEHEAGDEGKLWKASYSVPKGAIT